MGSDFDLAAADAEDIYFNPRSPHGERRDICRYKGPGVVYFNPRSPYGERLLGELPWDRPKAFQSTLPAWGATSTGRPAQAV